MRRAGQDDSCGRKDLRKSCEALEVYEYGPYFQFSNTQFFSNCQPLDYLCAFADYLTNSGMDYYISSDKLKLKYILEDEIGDDEVEVHVELLTVTP